MELKQNECFEVVLTKLQQITNTLARPEICSWPKGLKIHCFKYYKHNIFTQTEFLYQDPNFYALASIA